MIQFQEVIKITIIILVSAISISSHADEIKASPSDKITKILNEIGVPEAHIAYALYDASENKFLETLNSKKEFTPASLQKIFTTFYALSLLGDEYTFSTKLRYSGSIKEGVLKGNLYLIGSGDPSFISGTMVNFILAMKEQGIKKVEGKLILCNDRFISTPRLSRFGLDDQTYNPGLSFLNLDFNRFQLKKENSSLSAKADFLPIPPLSSFIIEKDFKSFTPGMHFRFDGEESKQEKWTLSTYENYSYLEEVPIRFPHNYTGETFIFMAQANGISIPSYEEGADQSTRTIYQYRSPDLKSIASLAMEYSNNLYSEALLVKAAIKNNSKVNSIEMAAQTMKEWYVKKFGKELFAQSTFVNGSGLSVSNLTTVENLATFIGKASATRFDELYYLSLFSLSGHNGWIKKRLNSQNTSYRVWAKTGSLDYVNNIAGFINTKSGKTLYYAIFSNDFEKRKALEGENNQYLNTLRNGARSWNHKTDRVLDTLLEDWILRY